MDKYWRIVLVWATIGTVIGLLATSRNSPLTPHAWEGLILGALIGGLIALYRKHRNDRKHW